MYDATFEMKQKLWHVYDLQTHFSAGRVEGWLLFKFRLYRYKFLAFRKRFVEAYRAVGSYSGADGDDAKNNEEKNARAIENARKTK